MDKQSRETKSTFCAYLLFDSKNEANKAIKKYSLPKSTKPKLEDSKYRLYLSKRQYDKVVMMRGQSRRGNEK